MSFDVKLVWNFNKSKIISIYTILCPDLIFQVNFSLVNISFLLNTWIIHIIHQVFVLNKSTSVLMLLTLAEVLAYKIEDFLK